MEGIKVRVVAKCDDEAVAARILDSEERIIRALLGDVIFGVDKQSMEVVVLDGLRRKGLTLAIAETVTGGLLASRMSDPTMEIFRGARIGRDSRESTQLTPEQRQQPRRGSLGVYNRPFSPPPSGTRSWPKK
jgi:nicotinamide-nucleotide amidase